MVGGAAASALLTFYFATLALAESLKHALSTFTEMWYLILPLVIGFGVQAGLYYHLKNGKAGFAAAGGLSSTSMVACCAHHAADVLPILGFSAAAAFLGEYQKPFMVVGIFSNLIGIAYMTKSIRGD
jgi:hypothetical protein